MTTPPTTATSSSPTAAEQPIAALRPAPQRLSFSVAALLADDKKDSSTTKLSSSPSPSSSPTSHLNYPQFHAIRVNPMFQQNDASQSPADLRMLSLTALTKDITDLRVPPPNHRFSESPKDFSTGLSHQHQSITGYPKSPTSSSQGEANSRCSDDDVGSLVDVEDLHERPESTPAPVRPTPGYVGGFSSLGNLSYQRLSAAAASLHPALWTGHPAAAAAAAAAAQATFFPSHFHHAPLNGMYLLFLFFNFVKTLAK